MKANGEQGAEVILAHLPGLPVGEGSHGNRGQTGQQIDLHHTAIHDHENKYIQGKHGQLNDKGLQEQPQQRAKFHRLQTGLQRVQHIRGDIGTAADNSRRACDHALGNVKNRHDNIKGVGEDEDGTSRFEYPLVDIRNIELVHIVLFQYHLDQLIGCDKG